MTNDDITLLDKAQHHVQTGEWEQLVLLDNDMLPHHSERDKLAAYAAMGHMYVGNLDTASRMLLLALEWGCPKPFASRLTIAAVYHSLGRLAILRRDHDLALRNFENSLALVASNEEAALRAPHQALTEATKMGLLVEASEYMSKELTRMETLPRVHPLQLELFKTELELLTHELSLAQQRQQLSPPSPPAQSSPAMDSKESFIADLKKKTVSQLGQDLWVLEKTNFKQGGFFVEFGATDGVLLSNTYLLEQSFNWTGICAEPNPNFFEALKKNRRCIASNQFIGPETGKEYEFITASAYGGAEQFAYEDQHCKKREVYRTLGYVLKLTSISLHDFLLQHNAPKTIDYLSIDTEGSELEIIASFPFHEWNIRLLTVEHNFTKKREKIQEVLANHGYRQTALKWDDCYEKIDFLD